ncbi:MAG: hypothetical protein LBP59_13550 [Planctomycetaceae bacterium]|jgi:hypothetical protein|nr:hypothetical protein [Planctomycetaceae bacterium]
MKRKSFSPFAVFRRNQVAGLAGLGIMAMIAFIILPAIMQLLTGVRSGEGQGYIADTRHHGKIDPQLIDNLRRNRDNLARFYQRLWMVIIQSNPSILTQQSQQTRLGYLAMKAQQLTQNISDEELINNWLLARYAEDQGIDVSPDAIINQLKLITDDFLTKQNLNQVIEELNINDQYLEYLIAEETRQNQMTYLFIMTQNAILPSTRWDWFQRLNKQMTLEVATLPVEAFINQTPEPTPAQVKRFFDENKKNKFNPTKPETGFIYPKQIAFSYVKGTINQKLLDTIPKQDVEKYYQENKKELFRKPVPQKKELQTLPEMENNNTTTNLGRLGNFIPGLNLQNTQNQNATENTQPEIKPEIKPEPKSETQPEPKLEPKQNAEPTPENKPNNNNENIDKNKESNLANNFRYNNLSKKAEVKLVSFQNETASETKETTPKEQPEPNNKTEKENDTKKIEVKTADEKKVDEKTEEKKTENKPAETKTNNDNNSADLNSEYKPLSEVEDGIRRHLAQVKIDAAFVELESRLRVQYDIYRKYIDQKIADPKAIINPPALPDFSDILSPYGLVVVTEGGTIFDVMRRSEFVSGDLERNFIVNWFKGRPYEYQVNKIGDDNLRILIWATDFKDEVEPTSIDGDDVLYEAASKRWREVRARDIAFKSASELAELAKGSKESLKVVLESKSDKLSITETEPFTWLTFGYAIDSDSPVRFGEIREKGVPYGEAESGNKYIFAPGEDFMRVASGLDVGEVGITFNQPKTTVHIIKLISTMPAEDLLWERFKTAPPQIYLQIGQRDKIIEAREAWLESIRSEMGFKWINKPKENDNK